MDTLKYYDGDVMKKALIVSKTEASIKAIAQLLSTENYENVDCTVSTEDGREKVLDTEYDLIVINTPLSEESGIDFSIFCADNTKSCVILVVQQEKAMEVASMVDSYGVLVIQKPVNKHLFHHYMIFTQCFKERLLSVESENKQLKSKLEEVKIVNRAKLLLMQCLSMTEKQAHRYIEKQAMDMRTNKLTVAKQVIKTYEN